MEDIVAEYKDMKEFCTWRTLNIIQLQEYCNIVRHMYKINKEDSRTLSLNVVLVS